MPSYGNPPTVENIMQMIFDTQTSIGVLSTAVGELTARMNDFVKNGPAPAQAQSVRSTKSMVACPKPWDGKGDSAAARHFLAAFANWATSQKEKMNRQTTFGVWVKTDMDWIQAALNLMEGDARTWCLPALEKLRQDEEPYDGRWSKFEDEFTKRFIPQDPGEAAREALKRLYQGKRSVAEYKAKFEEHSSLTGWSKADLRSRFYDGLSDAIKDALAISDRPTEAYESLVDAAQALDIRLRQRQAEKKGQTFHQVQQPSRGTESVPMDIDASRQQGHQGQSGSKKPSRSEFLKKMKGKCFGCGSSDHSKQDGHHERDVCNHCKKTGHRSTVCFAKYMGREKAAATSQAPADSNQGSSGQSANSTQQAQSQPQATASANATHAGTSALQKQIAEMQKQIEALKASF